MYDVNEKYSTWFFQFYIKTDTRKHHSKSLQKTAKNLLRRLPIVRAVSISRGFISRKFTRPVFVLKKKISLRSKKKNNLFLNCSLEQF